MKKLAVTLGIALLLGMAGMDAVSAQQNGNHSTEALPDNQASVLSEEETMRLLPRLAKGDEDVAALYRRMRKDVAANPDAPATLKRAKAADGYFTPPFVCNFDAKTDLDNWAVLDGDGDAFSWAYEYHENWPALNGSTEGGCIFSIFNQTTPVDDWLVTAKPVRFSDGKAYIAFLYAGGSVQPTDAVRLGVYYGTESDPDKMNELETWTFYGRHWRFKLIEVDLAAGDYYFALRACSDANKARIYVDEIEIGAAPYTGVPDLSLDYMYLPLSSCALDEGEVALRLVNLGKTAIERFELSYSVNGGEAVTEAFDVRIPLLDTVKVAFTAKADLSEAGKNFKLRVDGTVKATESGLLEPSDNLKNNMMTDSVRHFTEAALPFVTDMNKAEDRAQWGFATGTWSYDPTRVLAIKSEDTLPLVSRCMPLQKGRNYRFAFDYVAGIDIFGLVGTDEDFDVLCGIAGTPVESWEVVRRYEKVMTDNMLVSDEIVISPEEDGVYAFAIVSRITWGVLYIQKVSVTEIKEHDMVLSDWVTRLGRMTPARHAVKPSFEALVANRGMNDETGVKMVIRQGGNEIGGTAEAAIRKDSLAVFRPIDGVIEMPKVGDEVTLSLSVEMPAVDGNPYNNTAEFTFSATDTLYAFDYCVDNPSHGVSSSNFGMGNIFTLAETDTLTAVMVSWVDLQTTVQEDFDVAVEIYPVNMRTGRVSDATMHYEVKRGLGGGWRTIEVPAHIMPAGSYLIGLRQLGSQNISVAVDDDLDGYFFITGNGAYAIQAGKGFLGVRAVFGTVTSLKAKDILVRSIDAPKEKGAFTGNQAIRATYANLGYEDVDVEFKCTVNGEVKTRTQKVKGYGTGRIAFTADMAEVGEYNITVEAVLAGDEDPSNNAVKKTVNCVFIDPRKMDFEYCDDFATSGFEPAWKSVDMDGNKPGPHNMNFPNSNVPFGFMAYNSVLAGERDEYTGEVVNAAHSGDRFGLSLLAYPKNDDWLISPEFAMAKGAGKLAFSFWVRSWDPNYPEHYNVLVSTTDDKPASFKAIASGYAPGEWTRVEYDLSDYAGQNIYVAIQCVSEDSWWFMVDDIEVFTGDAANEKDVDLSRYVRGYPNPVADMWTVTAYGLVIDRIEIGHVTGGVVYRSAGNLATESYRVSMGGFTPGLYMARVYTNAGVHTLKVVVR